MWQDAARGCATVAGRALDGPGPAGLDSGCCAEARDETSEESASAPAIAAILIGARSGHAGIDVTG
ncbi:hypothetical protein JCM18382A_35760 [Bradyrhizobium sp. 17-4]